MYYFLFSAYLPNSAPTNRALAMLRQVDLLGINTIAVFLSPNKDKSKLEEKFRNVKIDYYWNNFYLNIPIVRIILYYINIFRFCLRLKKKDTVFCVYGLMDAIGLLVKRSNVRFFYEVTENPELMLPLFKTNPSIDGLIKSFMKLTGLFVISSTLKDYFIEKGIPEYKIHIINMTVDAKRFENVKKNNPLEKYFAYCGTVSNNKDGVNDLLKAFAIVSKVHEDVKLYIIGKSITSDEATQNLELIKELRISEKVVLTGVVSAERMPQLLKNAVGLVLDRPDNIQAKYGFPTKLGEYLMTANPVVVTSVGDIPLFLKDGYSALIAPPCNPKAFADKMIWLLEHSEECKLIGERGRDVAMKHFNAQIETNKIISVITKA